MVYVYRELNERERDILRRRLNGETLRSIAADYPISYGRVGQIGWAAWARLIQPGSPIYEATRPDEDDDVYAWAKRTKATMLEHLNA